VVPVVQATPLGVPVPVVGLMVPLTGLPVPLTGIMEADDRYGMMTITLDLGLEVIRHGVEVEVGVEAIPPPLVVLPPVSRSLILNLLLILGARLHMPSLSIPPSPRRSLVQATLVEATLGVLVAGVMMDTLGMVAIGVVVIAGNLVHRTSTKIMKQVTRLSVRRFLLLLLLVLPATGRRRYVNVVSLVVENVSSSFSHILTTPLLTLTRLPLQKCKGGMFPSQHEKPAVDASSLANSDSMDNETVASSVYESSPSSYVEMTDPSTQLRISIPPPPPPAQSSRFGKLSEKIGSVRNLIKV